MISAIILTKNEEKNIVDCIETLSWCDEVIVVDDESEDRTSDLAQKIGARVFAHSLNNNFSEQRNFAQHQASNEWVLFVDADERVSKELATEIVQVINNPHNPFNGFFVKRTDSMFGKKLRHGEVGNIKLLRLAKKETGSWEGKVHETWKIKGKIGDVKNSLTHYPHQSIAEFLSEINFYTTIRAKELYEKKIKVNALSIILYPKAKFIFGYIFKQGFRDGVPGFIFAIFMSFHSFLVRSKLWLLWNRK